MTKTELSSIDRISELLSISDDVPILLQSAGLTMTALSGNPLPNPSDGLIEPQSLSDTTEMSTLADKQGVTIDSAKRAFTTSATTYFTTLQSIMARLRRQVYALEEAGIISSETPALSSTTTVAAVNDGFSNGNGRGSMPMSGVARRGLLPGNTNRDEGDKITNGGMGGLDVSWLNSRVGTGGKEMEMEILDDLVKTLGQALKDQEMALIEEKERDNVQFEEQQKLNGEEDIQNDNVMHDV